MQLTSYEAYAVWVARALAQAKEPVKKADLADRLGVDEGYVQQVLIFLQKAGLVESRRGSYGGYLLTRDPRKLSVLAVLDAAHGKPLFQTKDDEARALKLARRWMREELTACLAKTSILDVPLDLRSLQRG